jgi:hypothetical protein
LSVADFIALSEINRFVGTFIFYPLVLLSGLLSK